MQNGNNFFGMFWWREFAGEWGGDEEVYYREKMYFCR